MPDFNVRADSVNVEQIMEQIRARIREKRGVDYTEEQIKELAAVKLEKFLDPRGVRSDLLAEFRRSQPPPAPFTEPLYAFEDSTLFESHRAIVRFFRGLLKPFLKLFFNPNVLAHVLHAQAEINRQQVERVQNLEASLRHTGELYYELLHNLVLEVTRATIEVKNLKMLVESLGSRLEFNERRARALESAVVYRATDDSDRPERPLSVLPDEAQPRVESRGPREQRLTTEATSEGGPAPGATSPAAQPVIEGPGQRSRRRRRRRGRRGGASAVTTMGGQVTARHADAPGAPGTTIVDGPSPDSARTGQAEVAQEGVERHHQAAGEAVPPTTTPPGTSDTGGQ